MSKLVKYSSEQFAEKVRNAIWEGDFDNLKLMTANKDAADFYVLLSNGQKFCVKVKEVAN